MFACELPSIVRTIAKPVMGSVVVKLGIHPLAERGLQ
jgi:hypothetical protein